jgi:hypothetical protein
MQEKFGEEISIVRGGKKIGLKHVDEMDGANTDELAANSDLDTSTRKLKWTLATNLVYKYYLYSDWSKTCSSIDEKRWSSTG